MSKKTKILLLNFLIIFIILILASGNSTNNEITDTQEIPIQGTEVENTNSSETLLVTRIVDGDTIELENGQKVRYIGIDTPETVAPNKEVECFGKEASTKNSELVLNKQVKLEKDVSETDKYGRLLRYVYIDGIFVNDYLVRQGFANASSYPPDIKYQEQFTQAEQEARNNYKGLWGPCNSSKNDAKVTQNPNIKPTESVNPTITNAVIQTKPSQSKYTCDCKKTCPNISSCEEAQYLLNTCGCSARDGDKDGIACDGAPLNCQN